jgi:uncharacterized cupredoxin-like copper-binding protein
MWRHRAILVCRTGAGLSILAALTAALSGCASASGANVASGMKTVRVDERDFKIEAPEQLRAGRVTFTVHNRGPDTHELILVRQHGNELPLRTDGLTIDEDAVQKDEAGALEPGKPGGVRTLTVRLEPGRYVLFCNMSGHYLGGMDHDLVVR